MTKPYSQANHGLTVSSPLGDDDLICQSIHGEDRISGLFLYQLECWSEKPDLDMTSIVGEPVTAKIDTLGNECFFRPAPTPGSPPTSSSSGLGCGCSPW